MQLVHLTLRLASRVSLSSALSKARFLRSRSLLRLSLALNAEGSADSAQSLRTYVHPRTYTFVRPHMRGHEQHPQTRSGSPHNACISLVIKNGFRKLSGPRSFVPVGRSTVDLLAKACAHAGIKAWCENYGDNGEEEEEEEGET